MVIGIIYHKQNKKRTLVMGKFTDQSENMVNRVVFAVIIFWGFGIAGALAEDKKPEGGSDNILINGQKAKRAGDMDPDDVIYSTNVFKNGKPAIIGCKKGVPVTSPNVFINGRPAVLGCKKIK